MAGKGRLQAFWGGGPGLSWMGALPPAPACCPAGWVTEGEAAFGEMSGSAPVSIHQQALRGIAQVRPRPAAGRGPGCS